MKKLLATIIIIIIAPLLLAAMPVPKGFVTDDAGVMRPETVKKLESYLSSLEAQTGVEIAVVTVKSLDGDVVDNYAVALFKNFGVGKKGKDNGALFLVAPSEHQMRIEVGYGLEGAVNDAMAGRILDTYAVPRFKAGDMDGGIESATAALVSIIVERENLTFNPSEKIEAAAPAKEKDIGIFGKIIILLILGYIFIRHPWLFLFFLSSSGGGRSSGGFGGGSSFGGFGGGMSGGGGASRGW